MKKHRIAALLILVLICGLIAGTADSKPSVRKLTLMIYMCGSNLESLNGSASSDIQEILDKAEISGEMTVLILTGGSDRWVRFPSDRTMLHEIGPRGMRTLWTAGENENLNMGDPATLEFLLNWGVENNPAEDYALILWNHGAGPMKGVCRDDLFSGDMMSLGELTEALNHSALPGKLSWIGFDACLMSSLEVAAAVSPYADYMIASEELEPEIGWDYSFLNDLPGCTTAAEAGQAIVDRYVSQEVEEQIIMTLSCLDLQRMETVLRATDDLFESLMYRLNGETFSLFSNARRSSLDIGRQSSDSAYDLVDLFQFSAQFETVAPDQVAALHKALDNAVYARGNLNRSCGVSLYSPLYNRLDFQSEWQEEYQKLDFLPVYTRYMDRFAGIWLGEQLADWILTSYGVNPASDKGTQSVLLELTDDQLTHFGSAKVVILRETGGSDTYQKIYEIDDISPDGHTLTADYHFDGLYVVNEAGELLTDSYPFRKEDGMYYVNAILETESLASEYLRLLQNPPTVQELISELFSDPESADRSVRLAFRPAEDRDDLELVNIIFYDESDQIHLGRQSLHFNAELWPCLYFIESNFPLRLTRNEEGRILPASQWPVQPTYDFRTSDLLDEDGHVISSGQAAAIAHSAQEGSRPLHFWGEVQTDGNWSLRFLPQQMSGLNLYAQFIVTDTQGNETATELIPLENQAVVSSAPSGEEIFSGSSVTVRLTQTEVIRSKMDSGLVMRFHVRNDSDVFYRLTLLRPTINRSGLPEYLHSYQRIQPNSDSEIYIRLPLDLFPPLPDGFIHTISFVPVLEDASGGMIAGKRITVTPEADVSVLDPRRELPGIRDPLGESAGGEVRFTLTGLREEPDGTLTGTVRLANLSEQDLFLFMSPNQAGVLDPVVLNGHYMANSLEIFRNLALPAGNEADAEFRIRRRPFPDPFGNIISPAGTYTDLLDYWHIDRVESLGFFYRLAHGNDDFADVPADAQLFLADIPFHVPVSLQHRSGASPGICPLIDSDRIRIDLREMNKKRKALNLLMDIRNICGERQIVTVPWCAVNGREVTVSMQRESDPDSWVFTRPIKERVLFTLSLPWELINRAPESIEMLFYINGENSQEPPIQRILLSVSEAENESGYRFSVIEPRE